MANQFANVLVQAIAGAAAGWASAVTKQDFLSPIIRAQENMIGQKQRAKERQEDRDHAERMAQLTAKLNKDQARFTSALELGNQKEFAKFKDELDDDNRLLDNERADRLLVEERRFQQGQIVLAEAAKTAAQALAKGESGPMRALMQNQLGLAFLQADANGQLGEPGDNSVTDIISSGPVVDIFAEFEDAGRTLDEEKISGLLGEVRGQVVRVIADDTLPPTEKRAQLGVLKERVQSLQRGQHGEFTFDINKYPINVDHLNELSAKLDAGILAANDEEARRVLTETGDYSEFGAQFVVGGGVGPVQVTPTGALSETDLRRRHAPTAEELAPKYQNLAELAALIADPASDFSMDDVPAGVRPIMETLVQQTEGGQLTNFAAADLMDQITGDRQNAPALMSYLTRASSAELSNLVATTGGEAAKRNLKQRQDNALSQQRISIKGESVPLTSTDFKFEPGDFTLVAPTDPQSTGAVRTIALTKGAEKGIVDRFIVAHDLPNFDAENPASVVDAANVVEGIESLASRLNLSEEDTMRLLREVTPRFEEVKVAAFEPGNAFQKISEDSTKVDNHPSAQVYFSETVGPDVINKRWWWKKDLRKTADKEQRKDIYRKHGYEYDEQVDGFIMSGGQYFGRQVVLASLPGSGLTETLTAAAYEARSSQLELQLAEMITAGSASETEITAKEKEIAAAKAAISGEGQSETFRAQATELYLHLGRAIAFGPKEVEAYIKANEKRDSGLATLVDLDKGELLTRIENAYTSDFGHTFENILNMYMPRADLSGTAAGKADFKEYLYATYPSVTTGLEAAANFNPKDIPTFMDDDMFTPKDPVPVMFKRLAYILSNADDLVEASFD